MLRKLLIGAVAVAALAVGTLVATSPAVASYHDAMSTSRSYHDY